MEKRYDEKGRPLFASAPMTPEQIARRKAIQEEKDNRYPLKIGDVVKYNGGKFDGRTAEVIAADSTLVTVRHDRTGSIHRHQWFSGFVTNMTRLNATTEQRQKTIPHQSSDQKLGMMVRAIMKRYGYLELEGADNDPTVYTKVGLDVPLADYGETLDKAIESVYIGMKNENG